MKSQYKIEQNKELTKRETEILALISQGKRNYEIADILSLSEKTVKNHISNIFQKKDYADRTTAAIDYLRKNTEYIIIDWRDEHSERLAELYQQQNDIRYIALAMDMPVQVIKKKLDTLGLLI